MGKEHKATLSYKENGHNTYLESYTLNGLFSLIPKESYQKPLLEATVYDTTYDSSIYQTVKNFMDAMKQSSIRETELQVVYFNEKKEAEIMTYQNIKEFLIHEYHRHEKEYFDVIHFYYGKEEITDCKKVHNVKTFARQKFRILYPTIESSNKELPHYVIPFANGVSHGSDKNSIYQFFLTHKGKKERESYIKELYKNGGWGGLEYRPYYTTGADAFHGMEIRYNNEDANKITVQLSFSQFTQEIAKSIEAGYYLKSLDELIALEKRENSSVISNQNISLNPELKKEKSSFMQQVNLVKGQLTGQMNIFDFLTA